jgi:hypothetical protein
MSSLFKIVAVDGMEYSNLDADTIRLWRDQGKVDDASRTALEETEDWYPLSAWFNLPEWSAPPLLPRAAAPAPAAAEPPLQLADPPVIQAKPPSAPFDVRMDGGMDGAPGFRRIKAVDFVLAALPLLVAAGLWWSGNERTDRQQGVLLAVLGTLAAGSVAFLLLRCRLSRKHSALGCLGTVVVGCFGVAAVNGVVARFQAEAFARRQALLERQALLAARKRMENHDLDLQEVGDTFQILAPGPFKPNTLRRINNPSIYFGSEYESVGVNLLVAVTTVQYCHGYYGNPAKAMEGFQKSFHQSSPEMVPAGKPVDRPLGGIPGQRLDFETLDKATLSQHQGSTAILFYSYPKDRKQTQCSVTLFVSADFKDPAKEKEILDRIVGSFRYAPANGDLTAWR